MYFSLLVNASTNGTFLYSVSQWKDPTNKQTNVCVCVSQALLCHTHTHTLAVVYTAVQPLLTFNLNVRRHHSTHHTHTVSIIIPIIIIEIIIGTRNYF